MAEEGKEHTPSDDIEAFKRHLKRVREKQGMGAIHEIKNLVTGEYGWEEDPDKRRPLLMILEDGDGEEYRYPYDEPNFEPVITLIEHLEQYPELIDNKDPIEEVLFMIGNEIPPTKKALSGRSKKHRRKRRGKKSTKKRQKKRHTRRRRTKRRRRKRN
jgi:hypothetical protein